MKNYLILGDWNAICDSCGRKYKASMLRKRWDGLMVCPEDYETRHPQDFLRIQKEHIAAPWARPEGTDVFTSYICSLEESQGLASIGSADCARCEIIFPIGDAVGGGVGPSPSPPPGPTYNLITETSDLLITEDSFELITQGS